MQNMRDHLAKHAREGHECKDCQHLLQYTRREKSRWLSTNIDDDSQVEDRQISDGEGASAKAMGEVDEEGGSLANDLFSLHSSLHLLS